MAKDKEKKEKIEYVKSSVIASINADFILILGERSNGKSFACKELAIKDFLKTGNQFAYLRRYDEDTKDYLIAEYFDDVIHNKNGHDYIFEWTNGEYSTITCYRKSIYLANTDDEGRIVRGAKIGRMFGLSNTEHYKSLSFPNIDKIIFEEFITDGYYLPSEPKKLFNIASTIFRHNKGKVYCIGNKVSRLAPYFGEWNLHNVPRQKINTIEIYKVKNEDDEDGEEIKIAVYMTHTMKINKMFFGNSAKAMTKGEWETDVQPHLQGHRDDYDLIYSLVFKYDRTMFLCEFLQSRHNPNNFTWYVTPKTTPIQDNTRVCANSYNVSYLCTIGFVPLTKNERVAFDFMRQGKICFCDNLTGTEFKQCYNRIDAL